MAPFASAKSWKSPSPALQHIGSAVTSVQGFEAPPEAVVLEALGCQRFDCSKSETQAMLHAALLGSEMINFSRILYSTHYQGF